MVNQTRVMRLTLKKMNTTSGRERLLWIPYIFKLAWIIVSIQGSSQPIFAPV